MPKIVRDAHGLSDTVRMTLLGMAGVVVVAAVTFAALSAGLGAADGHRLDVVKAGQAEQSKLNALQDVRDYYSGFDQRRKAVAAVLQTDVDYSKLINAIYAALPPGVSVKDIATSFGTVCAGDNPFNPQPAIGCITIHGSAGDQSGIGAFTSNLSAVPGGLLVDPYASGVSAGSAGVGFQVTVNFTNEAYSGKFAQLMSAVTTAPTGSTAAGTTPDAQGIQATPSPTPTPTPTPGG